MPRNYHAAARQGRQASDATLAAGVSRVSRAQGLRTPELRKVWSVLVFRVLG